MNNEIYAKMKNDELVARLEKMVALEKRTTAEILEFLVHVNARKLFLEKGYTSLFAYLTEGLKYSAGSAQRRIEAARILREFPETHEKFQTGALNLGQVSILAHGLRQKPVDLEVKRQLLQKIVHQDLQATQKILCRELNLPVLTVEKSHLQKDDSQRMEITFTAQQMEYLERLKEVISHTHAGASWADHIEYAVKYCLKRRDPSWEDLSKIDPTVLARA